MLRFLRLLALAFCILAAPFAAAQKGDRRGEEQKPLPATVKVPPAPVRTPEEERATFTLAPGFRAELIAAEPLIGDPIAMEFGPDGRLWVLEMRGYMPNVNGDNEREPVGVIAVLEDSDGDGRYDKRSEFVGGLVLPRAFALVGDGVLVGEPTNLWFFRDNDGDGKSDSRTSVATDYGNTNNPEHNANGLMHAMDNWIYSANYTARFRWQGDAKFAREATVTRGQWGISQDDLGRLYYNSNSDPLRFDAAPSAYLKRNPNFSAAGANVQLVPATLRIWPGRMTPGVNRGYKTLDGEYKLTAMTAACGPVVYRGAMFAEEFRGDAFVAEPSANMIKRIKLTDKDGVLRGANAYEGREFMTSRDERFRPVNLYNGPDGALYVVDFYRGIIQHRIYVTSFLRQQIEERGLDKGIAKGRIWRIVPDGAPKVNFQLGLARASSAGLAGKLGDANGWVRDTAQRLLAERRDPGARPILAKLAVDAGQPALARLHALWALEGGDALERGTVLAALRDRDPRVAAAAVRLSEKFFSQPGGDAELVARVASLVAARAEPEVRLQLAFTLGEARTAGTDEALRTLVIAAGRQAFLADAVVSGLAGREQAFVEALAKTPQAAARAGDAIRFATSAILKSGDATRIERVLALAAAGSTPEWARSALLAGVRHFLPRSPDGRSLSGNLPAEPKSLLALAEKEGTPSSSVAQQLLNQLKWPGKAGTMASVARALTPAEQTAFDQGKEKFATLCAACHQPNGQGLAGLAPSLIYSRWVLGDPRILARIVLNGKVQENLVMPPWKAALDDQAVAGVLTFIRRSWGHDAEPIHAGTVAEARKDTAKRDEPFSDADLEELTQSLTPARK
ncbi:MAG TPA: c-type cytochrome [Opitutaceae bacterium]|nr:c-type cytochrome [Opitutaceae bacterium]